ncbi:MAG: hypothetical protein KC656_10505 [Myxococcales bacterium]|nr:hypothetical protein [Myxococcales bacterium]MCA9568267.1 hypothetical protein [Myxococcales bacterium]
MTAAAWLVAAVVGWCVLVAALLAGLRRPSADLPPGGVGGVVVGGASMALGALLVLVSPWVGRPVAPPPTPLPPPPPPAPSPWPKTALEVAVHRPDKEPPFRDPTYRFRSARLVAFEDGVALGMDRDSGDRSDPCALDGGSEKVLFLRTGVDVEHVGAAEVTGSFALGGHGAEAWPVAGTLRLDRAEGERRAGVLDLVVRSKEPGAITGPFTAEITRCPGHTPLPGGGPGGVHFAFEDLDGEQVSGELTWAKVLHDVEGQDLLVFQLVPSEGCRPRAPGLHELDAIWLLRSLPGETGTQEIELAPDGWIAKTWTYHPPRGGSHNVGLEGTLTLDAVDDREVRGAIDAVAVVPYGPGQGKRAGTISGPFTAAVVDCSTWTDGYPL